MEPAIRAALPAAIGGTLAATIAAVLSWGNLVNSKEQKVSEFRQQWIDSLRRSIAEYLSALSYIAILYIHNSAKTNPTSQKDSFDMAVAIEKEYARVQESYNDIVLRINPQEDTPRGQNLNKEFLDALEFTRTLHNMNDFSGVIQASDAIRTAAKPLLKHEWKRVKRGEPTYRFARGIAVAVITIASFIVGSGLVMVLG